MGISTSERVITIHTIFGPVNLDEGAFEAIGELAESRGTDFPEAFNHLLEQGFALDAFARRVLKGDGDAMISMPARDAEPAFDVRFSPHDILDHRRFGNFLERVRSIF